MVALNISILFNKNNMSKHQTIFSNIPNKKTKKKKNTVNDSTYNEIQ